MSGSFDAITLAPSLLIGECYSWVTVNKWRVVRVKTRYGRDLPVSAKPRWSVGGIEIRPEMKTSNERKQQQPTSQKAPETFSKCRISGVLLV